jgi:hypothetical protein
MSGQATKAFALICLLVDVNFGTQHISKGSKKTMQCSIIAFRGEMVDEKIWAVRTYFHWLWKITRDLQLESGPLALHQWMHSGCMALRRTQQLGEWASNEKGDKPVNCCMPLKAAAMSGKAAAYCIASGFPEAAAAAIIAA